MRLNQASDFALRILMLLAASDKPLTVEVISDKLRLTNSHVMKLVAKLSRAGYVIAQRGRNGGVVLGKQGQDIIIGEVVRLIEADFTIVECMTPGKSACTFAPRCKLKGVMSEAGSAFLRVLDGYTLDTIVGRRHAGPNV